MFNLKTRKTVQATESEITKVAEEVFDEVQQVVDATGLRIEQIVVPIRKNILKRFLVLFLLAVTFGVTATFTGIEQILVQFEFLHSNTWVILCIGIGVLVITGTLYKKLGEL